MIFLGGILVSALLVSGGKPGFLVQGSSYADYEDVEDYGELLRLERDVPTILPQEYDQKVPDFKHY